MLDDFQLPVKWQDRKVFIRVTDGGDPEVIRIEPLINEEGRLIPQSVAVIIDNGTPMILDRGSADALIQSSYCVSVEKLTNHKHKMRN